MKDHMHEILQALEDSAALLISSKMSQVVYFFTT